jgi:hypothetical protein
MSTSTRLRSVYVGHSDGWQDLHKDFQLDWEFDTAEDGNVAVIGEVNLSRSREFTVGIAFGDSLHGAVTALEQSLVTIEVTAGQVLRIQAPESFRFIGPITDGLRRATRRQHPPESKLNLPISPSMTIRVLPCNSRSWTGSNRWEGHNYEVGINQTHTNVVAA